MHLHGYSKKRSWRKLHLGIDERTQEIVASDYNNQLISKEAQVLGDLLEQVDVYIRSQQMVLMIVLNVTNKYLNKMLNL